MISEKDLKPVIGMEVHVEINAGKKMFCGCDAHHFKIEPNSHICPTCVGLPGALPVPNKTAIEETIKLSMALGCAINQQSKFDRKHYFYPDLPKGYQISQYDLPFGYGGKLLLSDGKEIRITRVHLEEDTGKMIHKKIEGMDASLVDYNRSGVPLIEIVGEPDIESAAEAKEYLKLLRNTVRYLGISDADMEKGSMRLEANISVAVGKELPAYKVEVKNVNSFRYIELAIEYEIERQTQMLLEGSIPVQETRGWSLSQKKTVSQRVKETAKDYRYFPEPDIPTIEIDDKTINRLKSEIKLLPVEARDELMGMGVRQAYALVLIEDKTMLKYAIELVKKGKETGMSADKLVGMMVNKKIDWQKVDVTTVLGSLMVDRQKESMSETEMKEIISQVIETNKSAVDDYKAGKENAIKFLLGQVMKESRRRVDPAEAMKVLKNTLE